VDITGTIVAINDGIVGQCVNTNQAMIVDDVTNNRYFNPGVDRQSGFTTRSILCAPLSVDNTVIGAMEVVNKHSHSGRFNDADLMMLRTLASSIALAVINARISLMLVEQEKLRHELRLAGEIQRSLLPRLQAVDYPVYAVNRPAGDVSGDFYDYFDLDPDRIYFAIGDVAGKGMNASILMSKTSSLFRCLGKRIHNPAGLLRQINTELIETISHGMFVTMVAGILTRSTGAITLANAGHVPPLLLAAGRNPETFPAEVPPLGIMSSKVFDDSLNNQQFNLTDATLYLYTDGITEARLADHSMLAEDGLIQRITANIELALEPRINRIVETLGRDVTIHDDITLMAIEPEAVVSKDSSLH
jgi:sigma-B regulation protein RsbU (phosphoserine phosphatase)